MVLDIVGAGFPRTGTLTLKEALDHLGYKTYHMFTAIGNHNNGKDDLENWAKAGVGAHVDFQKMFKGYNSTVDFPSQVHYKELLRLYPEAKVILTVRDPEEWYSSALVTVMHYWTFLETTTFFRLLPHASRLAKLMDQGWAIPVFGGHRNLQNKAHCIEVFKRNIEEVKKVVPADQLLVFDVKEGWEPLCKFLGKKVPSEPFPNVNDRKTFQKMFSKFRWIDRCLKLLAVAVPVGLGFLAKTYFS